MSASNEKDYLLRDGKSGRLHCSTQRVIDWLPEFEGEDFGYAEFLRFDRHGRPRGRRTYDQVLSFGDYPYSAKDNIVFSKTLKTTEHAEIVAHPVAEFAEPIRKPDRERISGLWEAVSLRLGSSGRRVLAVR